MFLLIQVTMSYVMGGTFNQWDSFSVVSVVETPPLHEYFHAIMPHAFHSSKLVALVSSCNYVITHAKDCLLPSCTLVLTIEFSAVFVWLQIIQGIT